MANRCSIFILPIVALMVGCQQEADLMVDSLPAPNFNGPAFNHAPAPRPSVALQPPPPAPQPWITTPAPAKPASVPGDWLPSVRSNDWRWIVIHHSATTAGGAAAFDRMHRGKGWDELGYHFVIGNGSQTRDGQIEVGPRWPKQKWGAHAKTPDNRYNDFGIGICLVGNFDLSRPSAEQLRAVSKLVAYLMKAYRIPADRVIGHGDTKPTDCPGRNMNLAQIRWMSAKVLADAGDSESPAPIDTRTAAAPASNLMFDVPRP